MEDELELDEDLIKFEAMANGTWVPDEEESEPSEEIEGAEEVTEDESEEETPVEEDVAEEDLEADNEPEDVEDEVEDEVEDIEDETPPTTDVEEPTVDPRIAFYDALMNAEYQYNGKKVKAPEDPAKFIEAINVANQNADKASKFRQAEPFIEAMKDGGLLDDQDKFRLALDLIKGDPEAIKKHIKDLDIDPLDMDLEEIAYKPSTQLKTQVSYAINDAINIASQNGYGEKYNSLVETILEDDVSFDKFSKDPIIRQDFLNHMQDGTYDKVMSEVNRLSAFDFDNRMKNTPFIEKYAYAFNNLPPETPAVTEPPVSTPEPKVKPQIDEASLREQIRKELKEEQAAASRKKASSVSKRKVSSPPKSKVVNPIDLDGDEFDKHMEFLISGGRG